jgi:hypothetical protein
MPFLCNVPAVRALSKAVSPLKISPAHHHSDGDQEGEDGRPYGEPMKATANSLRCAHWNAPKRQHITAALVVAAPS